MGLKVYKADLNSSNFIALLDSDIRDTDNLINELNSFISGSVNTLTGNAYDVAREEIESFVSILNQRKSTANELKSAIFNAMSSLSGYMGSYDYLDDSELETLNNEINNIRASYENIKEGYREEADNSLIKKVFLNKELTNIDKECSGLIAPLLDEIEKIKGLAGADASAYGCLSGVSTSSYMSAIIGK